MRCLEDVSPPGVARHPEAAGHSGPSRNSKALAVRGCRTQMTLTSVQLGVSNPQLIADRARYTTASSQRLLQISEAPAKKKYLANLWCGPQSSNCSGLLLDGGESTARAKGWRPNSITVGESRSSGLEKSRASFMAILCIIAGCECHLLLQFCTISRRVAPLEWLTAPDWAAGAVGTTQHMHAVRHKSVTKFTADSDSVASMDGVHANST